MHEITIRLTNYYNCLTIQSIELCNATVELNIPMHGAIVTCSNYACFVIENTLTLQNRIKIAFISDLFTEKGSQIPQSCSAEF